MLNRSIWHPRLLLSFTFLLISSGCSSVGSRGSQGNSITGEGTWVQPKKTTMAPEIRFRGVIESSHTVSFSPEVSGTIVWLVSEGQSVDKGDKIIQISGKEYEDSLEQTRLSCEEAKLDLEQGEIDYQLKLASRRQKVALKRLDKEFAEIELQQFLKSGNYPKFVELKLKIIHNENEIIQIKKEIKEKTVLRKKDFIPQSDIDELQVKLATIVNTHKRNKLALKLLFYKDPIRKVDLEERVKKSRRAYSRVERKLDMELRSEKTKKFKLQQELYTLEKGVQEMEKKLAQTTITAPESGVFFPLKTWVTEGMQEKIKVGNQVFPGWEIGEVADIKNLQLTFYVNEMDLQYFKPHQVVIFQLDGHSEKFYSAKISEIARLGKLNKNSIESLANLKISADIIESDAHVRLGRSVNLVISKKRISGYKLPSAAVFSDETVFVKGRGRLPVTVIESSGATVIISEEFSADTQVFVPGEKPKKTLKLKGGTIDNIIEDMAELVPERQKFISLPFSGKIEFLEKEGKDVNKGDLIARVDVKDIKKKLQAVNLEIKSLVNEKKKLELERDNFERKEKSDTDKLNLRLQISKLEKQIIVKPLSTKQLRLQKIEEDIINGDITQLQFELKEKSDLKQRGFVSEHEIELLKLKLDELKIVKAKITAENELERAGPTERSRKKREVRIARARIELNKLLAEKKLKTRKFIVRLAGIEKRLLRKRNRKKRYSGYIEKSKVVSPHKGSVLYVKRWTNSGLDKIKTGDNTRSGMSFVKIAGLSKFRVKGSVKEEFRRWLKVGQRVEFYLGRRRKTLYKGTLHSISPQAQEKSKSQSMPWMNQESLIPTDARVFEVVITINKHSTEFQPGKSVHFKILAPPFQNATLVPRNFIFFKDGRSFVTSLDGKRVPVKVLGSRKNNFIVSVGKSGILEIREP